MEFKTVGRVSKISKGFNHSREQIPLLLCCRLQQKKQAILYA